MGVLFARHLLNNMTMFLEMSKEDGGRQSSVEPIVHSGRWKNCFFDLVSSGAPKEYMSVNDT